MAPHRARIRASRSAPDSQSRVRSPTAANSSAAFRPRNRLESRCAVAAPNRRPAKRRSGGHSCARPRSTSRPWPRATPCATGSSRQALSPASNNVAIWPPRLSAKTRLHSANGGRPKPPQRSSRFSVRALKQPPASRFVAAAMPLKGRGQAPRRLIPGPATNPTSVVTPLLCGRRLANRSPSSSAQADSSSTA